MDGHYFFMTIDYSGSCSSSADETSSISGSSTSVISLRRSASVESSDSECTADIAKDKSDLPVQPCVDFPGREYGSSGSRSFQRSWYGEFPWIEYSVERDAAFCFPCRFFGVGTDKTFTSKGFRDWKHAKGKGGTLTYHDRQCSTHKQAVLCWKQYKSVVASDTSILAQLDRQGKKTIKDNRQYVKCLMECLLYCAQQGIALRGHLETNLEDGSVNVGNFRSLMVLQSRHDDAVRKRLREGPRNASWLGHDMQNELISAMAQWVLCKIIAEVKSARYFTIIADETKDVSKSEQL